MSTVFPSLSSAGYISDRNIIIKKLLRMFITSDENQSNILPIYSYKYIINTNEEGYESANEMKKALTDMYKEYYDTVSVNVGYEFIEKNSTYVYSLSITAIYDGTTYTMDEKIANNILLGG